MTRGGRLGVCGVAALLLAGCGADRDSGSVSPAPDPTPLSAPSTDLSSEALGMDVLELNGESDPDGLETRAAPDQGSESPEVSPSTVVAPEVASQEPEASEPSASTGGAASDPSTANGSQSPSSFEQGAAPERPLRFEVGAAPEWPFRGLVQLWYLPPSLGGKGWVLRYWSWDAAAPQHLQVGLEGLEIECLGRVALVVRGEQGVEVGGRPGDVSATFWAPWGGVAEPVHAPSEELLDTVALRPSNVAARTEGDRVIVGQGSQTRVYEMRRPLRGDGERWGVQARHDGDLFVMTVHPAHLECFPGVTWLSLAGTGELVACGANTAATAFVDLQGPAADLVLPEPRDVGTYLSCAPSLELTGGFW